MNTIITYEALRKLTTVYSTVYEGYKHGGIFVNAFENKIISHTFDNGIGTIVFENELKNIGSHAFVHCNYLTKIIIPNSVVSIDYEAFFDTNISQLFIPASVRDINNWAFSSCSMLSRIIVDPNNPVYDSRDNCNAIIDTKRNALILGCKNTLIPDSVEEIGQNAFYGCTELCEITIPNSVKRIEDSAFRFCESLTSVYIPSSVEYIMNSFLNCPSLSHISVSPENAVYDSRDNCNAIIISETNVLVVGCKSSIIPDSVSELGGNAFYGCVGLTKIQIPDSVAEIGGACFSECDYLKELNFPEGLVSICSSAFYGCVSLTSIVLPSSLTQIGRNAFHDCSSLVSIYCKAICPPECSPYCFVTGTSLTLYVPKEVLNLYQISPQWRSLSNIEGLEGTGVKVESPIPVNVVSLCHPETDLWVFFNPNQRMERTGDCTIRSYCAAENITWDEAFDVSCKAAKELGFLEINSFKTVENVLINKFGYTKCKRKRNEPWRTVAEFAQYHPTGIFDLHATNHMVTVKDGRYYDSWDSGNRLVSCYFAKG